jgi:hypothetical protein
MRCERSGGLVSGLVVRVGGPGWCERARAGRRDGEARRSPRADSREFSNGFAD